MTIVTYVQPPDPLGMKRVKSECSICLSPLDEVVFTTCIHKFHPACIKPWLIIKNTCPLCHMDNPIPDLNSERVALITPQVLERGKCCDIGFRIDSGVIALLICNVIFIAVIIVVVVSRYFVK